MNMPVSDDEIRQATGREWDYWFAFLADAEAAAAEGSSMFGRPEREEGRPPELDRQALFSALQARHPELTGEWQQAIVAEYEEEMGREGGAAADDLAEHVDTGEQEETSA